MQTNLKHRRGKKHKLLDKFAYNFSYVLKKIQKIIDVLGADFLTLPILYFYTGHTSLTKHSCSIPHNVIPLLEGLHWTASKWEVQLKLTRVSMPLTKTAAMCNGGARIPNTFLVSFLYSSDVYWSPEKTLPGTRVAKSKAKYAPLWRGLSLGREKRGIFKSSLQLNWL